MVRRPGATARKSFCRDAKGGLKTALAPSTVRGIAFTPKGYRLAFAYYGGASLWFPNTESPPEAFDWKGSHLDVTVSPDGRFLVTSMQENALHGWRIADKAHMRMSGYPSKVRSWSWSPDGFWLATSGADSCVIWPFKEKDGPHEQDAARMRRPEIENILRRPSIQRHCFWQLGMATAGFFSSVSMMARKCWCAGRTARLRPSPRWPGTKAARLLCSARPGAMRGSWCCRDRKPLIVDQSRDLVPLPLV